MPKLIFDVFTLLICEKNVANYALLRCKIFGLKIWHRKTLTNIMSEKRLFSQRSTFRLLSKISPHFNPTQKYDTTHHLDVWARVIGRPNTAPLYFQVHSIPMYQNVPKTPDM